MYRPCRPSLGTARTCHTAVAEVVAAVAAAVVAYRLLFVSFTMQKGRSQVFGGKLTHKEVRVGSMKPVLSCAAQFSAVISSQMVLSSQGNAHGGPDAANSARRAVMLSTVLARSLSL